MAPPEIKFNVGDLDAGGKQFTFPLRAAWIRGILEDHEATATGADGVLDVRASRSGNDIVVHGTLKAELEVPCARCLTPVALHIDQTLSLLFSPGKVAPPPIDPKAEAKAAREARDAKEGPKKKRKAEPEEYEISAGEADTLPYDGEIVQLDDVIRDELILETPIFPLCSEDCPGMSPPPGAPRGVGESTLDSTQVTATNSSSTNGGRKGDDSATTEADIDPRLLPLLRLKTQRD